MKHIKLVLLVLLPLFCTSQTISNKNPNNNILHSSINVTGGDISNEEGRMSYSLGRIYYLAHDGKKNNVIEGIQQPLILYINTIKEVEEIFKLVSFPNPVVNFFLIEASSYFNRSLKFPLTNLNGILLKVDKSAKVEITAWQQIYSNFNL